MEYVQHQNYQNKQFHFFLQNKAIQCVPVPLCSSRFITYAPSFICLGRLSLEKTPLNVGSFS